MTMAADWLLKRGGVVLGHLAQCKPDQPFVFCRFTSTSAFEEVRPLFEAELRLLNTGQMEDWEKAYQAIDALGLRLESSGGKTINEFLLHIDGVEAWFRY
jgi:hypothetical protein